MVAMDAVSTRSRLSFFAFVVNSNPFTVVSMSCGVLASSASADERAMLSALLLLLGDEMTE
jgi:hypothetical protein